MEHPVSGDLRHTETREWARENDDSVRIGITDFAQDELGDIVFVEFPDPEDEFEEGESFEVVERIKAVSDVQALVSGGVVETNDAIRDRLELINDEPFDPGWMTELESERGVEHQLFPSDYENQI